MRKKKVSPFSKIINGIKAKSAYEEKIGDKPAKNDLNTRSLDKDKILLNSAIDKNSTITNMKKKVSYTKSSTVNQKNINLGKINDALNNKMKNKIKYKYIINHNLNLVNQNSISLSVNNSKNDLKKILDNKIKTRNKKPKYKFIITPIITNKTLNIYTNNSSQINVSLNQINYKQKEKLETINYNNSKDFKTKKISYYSTTGLGLNKNLIRKNTDIKLDNFLNSDIVYRNKFKCH